MMLNNVEVQVDIQGEGDCVVLLHGWGQNRYMMQAIAYHLKNHYQVMNLDLPGFGESDMPKTSWSCIDYADFIYDLVQAFQGKRVILIAHSFGARIAFHYALKYPVEKMILTGAAGVRPKRSWRYYTKVYAYKISKKLHLPIIKGSRDYETSSSILRGILVKAVNDDITSELANIQTDTLLVFGELDEETPFWMGELMEQKMPHATLVSMGQDDHFAYFHQSERFLKIVDAYLRENA